MKKILVFTAISAFALGVFADNTKITFGFAETDITPPDGLTLACWKRPPAVAVHDNLYAQCIAMRDHKGRTMLFVGADMMYFEKIHADKVREHCLEKHGIEASDIIFSGSHTHNSPYARGEYGREILEKLIPMVDEAIANCTTAGKLRIGRTTSEMGVSRRLPWKNEAGETKIAFRPYAEGDFDKNLTILAFYDTSDKLCNFVWVYGCHTTGYGGYVDKEVQVTADFVGEIRNVFKQEFPNTGSVFMQGAGGDVKPRFIADELDSHGRTRFRPPTSAEMKEFGEKHGTKIARFIQTIKNNEMEAVDIKSALGSFDLTYDTEGHILKDKLPKREKLEENIASSDNEDEKTKLQRRLKGGWYAGGKPTSTWQNQRIQINDSVQILGMQGEACSGVSELLYEAFPDKLNVFVGYTMRGSYTASWRQQLEGGYEAKGYGPDIDETIVNAFNSLKVE